MKTFVFRSREDKCRILASMLRRYLAGNVLDVGCGQKYLAAFVGERYVGLDIAGSPDVVANAEYGLPFKDRSFDTVIAFDVLEHLENIHNTFDELCRVARQYVVIGLPNMYEWHFRIMFLLGKNISGKYGLPQQPPTDRHRWLFSLGEAMSFVRERAFKNGFSIIDEAFCYYRYRRLLPRLIIALGRLFAPRSSLFVYHYWAVLERNKEGEL